MRRRLDATYGRDLAAGAVRDDGFRLTTLTVSGAAQFDRVLVQEDVTHGQAVAGFVVEAQPRAGAPWEQIATGSTIGHKRILPVPRTRASAVRVRVLDAHGEPRLGRVSLHATPE